jgi:peptidoglycan/xylan/chitin deacetylase (PgdA/CDA1 family)
MLISRLLAICLGLFANHQIQAQAETTISTRAAEKTKSAAPEERITFSWIHVDGPYIAISFDDGPSATLTPKLLDILAAHHVKATFFVIGENAAAHPEILARAVHEGHEIGNHSWSHPYLAKLSDDAVRRQLQQTDDAIKSAIGTRPTLMRPPYGSLTARQKRWIHDEFGYRIVLWDVDPFDWKRPGAAVVCSRIVKQTRSGSIVLSHDIHPGTIEAMPCALNQLEAKGFKFVTVSELIGMALPETPKPVSNEAPKVPPTPTTTPRPPTPSPSPAKG